MSPLIRLNKIQVILLLCLITFQTDPAQGQAERYKIGLSLGLVTNRSQYWLGEPVLLTSRLVNWAHPAIRFDSHFGLEGSQTKVQIIKENNISNTYRGHVESRPVSATNGYLRYGKAHEFNLLMIYSRRGQNNLAFEHPGSYRVAFQQDLNYASESSRMRGPIAVVSRGLSRSFSVIEPPEEAKAAYELLKSNPQTFFDMSRQMASPATRALFQKIIDQHPDTRYAPYCLHALIGHASKLSVSDDRFRIRAQQLLKRAVADYPQYALHNELRIMLAQNLHNSGQMDAAFKILDALVYQSPDSLYRFRQYSILDGYSGGEMNAMLATSEKNWSVFDTLQLPELMKHNSRTRN